MVINSSFLGPSPDSLNPPRDLTTHKFGTFWDLTDLYVTDTPLEVYSIASRRQQFPPVRLFMVRDGGAVLTCHIQLNVRGETWVGSPCRTLTAP